MEQPWGQQAGHTLVGRCVAAEVTSAMTSVPVALALGNWPQRPTFACDMFSDHISWLPWRLIPNPATPRGRSEFPESPRVSVLSPSLTCLSLFRKQSKNRHIAGFKNNTMDLTVVCVCVVCYFYKVSVCEHVLCVCTYVWVCRHMCAYAYEGQRSIAMYYPFTLRLGSH